MKQNDKPIDLINDSIVELRMIIRGLFINVNIMHRHTTIQLPPDLNTMTPLKLAELYHELKIMLP